MKNLFLLLLSAIMITACGSSKKLVMGNKPETDPKPFIKKMDGEVVAVTKMKEKGRKIVADGKKYNNNEIYEFSTGKNTFRKIDSAKKDFAKKSYTGDISVYISSKDYTSTQYTGVTPGNPTGWSTHSGTITRYYIQKDPSPALMLMNYDHLKAAIAPGEPAYKYLNDYARVKKKARILKYTGIGVFAAAIALIALDLSDGANTAAGGCFLSGVGLMVWGYEKQADNFTNLQKAIGKHNGTYD